MTRRARQGFLNVLGEAVEASAHDEAAQLFVDAAARRGIDEATLRAWAASGELQHRVSELAGAHLRTAVDGLLRAAGAPETPGRFVAGVAERTTARLVLDALRQGPPRRRRVKGRAS